MFEGKLAQQVPVVGTLLSKGLIRREHKECVCVQAGDDAERLRGHFAFETVSALDKEGLVVGRRYRTPNNLRA